MVRTNLKQIKKYFKYFESRNTSSCTLGKSKAFIKGNHASNMERHVKRFHDKEFHNEKLSALQQRAGTSSSHEPQKKRMSETHGRRSSKHFGGTKFLPKKFVTAIEFCPKKFLTHYLR